MQPVWVVGDTWTYRGTDGKRFVVTVTGITEEHWSLETRNEGGTRHIALLNFDFSPNTYARFQWPLEVGKQYEATLHLNPRNNVGGVNEYHQTWKVEAYEPVTVPAGTFDAFRIRGSQCNVTQRNRCGDFLVWYSPRVKNWVKESFITSRWWDFSGKSSELLAYQVH